MEPLEIVSAFATIVQLIGQFQQGRKDLSQMGDQEFFDWLSEHHHEPIRKMIQENRGLQTGIAKLLRQDNGIILSKVNELGSIMSSVARQVGEFRNVFDALSGRHDVEPEVLKLLRDFVKKDWERFGLTGSGRNS